jgi:hypothetical protein
VKKAPGKQEPSCGKDVVQAQMEEGTLTAIWFWACKKCGNQALFQLANFKT